MPATHQNTILATIGVHNPVVDFWNNNNPTNTLVIHSHGMQDPPNRNLMALDLAGAPRRKNYAFTTPFNTALNNAGFLNNPLRMRQYVNAFIRNAPSFSSITAPSLKIYPYLFPIGGLDNALDQLFQSNRCDILKLCDINPYPLQQFIYLDDLLQSNHPVGGGSLYNVYNNFLLLTCRSSTQIYQIGMGGAVATYPNGLYTKEDRPAIHRYPFIQEAPF